MSFTKINAAGIGTTETVTVDGLTVINDGSFGGNLSVGGTITYEDVTNVDSVGIITARAGVLVGSGITLSKDGDVFFTGIATGNGSGLTALNASNLASGTVPTARLGSGTASSSTFLRGDSTFQTVNTDLVSDTSPQLGGDLASNGNDILFADNDKAIFGTGSDLKIYHNGTDNYIMASNGHIRFDTGSAELARITSDGKLLVGTTSVGNGNADELTVAGASDSGITIRSGSSNYGQIYFSRATSGTGQYEGYLAYQHSTDSLQFGTDHTERLRISSDGTVYPIGNGQSFNSATLPNGHNVQVNTTSSSHGFSVTRYSSSYAAYGLNIGRSKSNTIGTNSIVADGDDLGHITWYGADGTDFNQAAVISAQVDGTPSDGADMPGRLIFKTSADGSGTPTERFRITSNGDWKAAGFSQTYACMYRSLSNSSSSNMMNSTGVMVFASATQSMGNSDVYNTSNGRYTAPIRGLYLFNLNVLVDNSYSSGSFYIKAYINGSNTDIFYTYETPASNNYYRHVSGSHVIALNAGDYHQFYATAGAHVSNETNFSACLIQAY